MISLRQHAISLAAVFLALAVGVVLGSGVLSDTLLSGLRDQKKDLQGQIAQLTDEKNVLNEKLAAADDFNTQVSGRIVHDALAGKSVVLIRTPDANDDDLGAISRVLGQAGAVVGEAHDVERGLAEQLGWLSGFLPVEAFMCAEQESRSVVGEVVHVRPGVAGDLDHRCDR